MFVVRWQSFTASCLPADPIASLTEPQAAAKARQETKSSPRLVWLTDKGQLGAMKITVPLPFQED